MTRAQRYANHRGGRKYSHIGQGKVQRAKSEDHPGRQDKLEASRIFREVWDKCRAHEGMSCIYVSAWRKVILTSQDTKKRKQHS